MQQLLYVGGAAPLQLASLFKCEIAGRFKILSILLLDRGKPKMVSTIVSGSRIENISEPEMKMGRGSKEQGGGQQRPDSVWARRPRKRMNGSKQASQGECAESQHQAGSEQKFQEGLGRKIMISTWLQRGIFLVNLKVICHAWHHPTREGSPPAPAAVPWIKYTR